MTGAIHYSCSTSYAAVQLCLHSAAAMQRVETRETLYLYGFPNKTKLCSDSSYAEPQNPRKPLINNNIPSYAAMSPYRGAALLHSCQRAPRSGRANGVINHCV